MDRAGPSWNETDGRDYNAAGESAGGARIGGIHGVAPYEANGPAGEPCA